MQWPVGIVLSSGAREKDSKGACPAVDYRIADQRLFIDGAPLSFFSGSFQYWRISDELWAPILDKVKGMGFGIIETYMPWSVHETAPGEFDFGTRDPRKDVSRFLAVCHAAGVKVLARPGPHINAEMTYFGYPERIFADADLLARCADGTHPVLPAPPRMFPLPCYHHPRFQAEVRTYFEALAGSLGGERCLHPSGPVIAIQADNECSKFMRANPFDWDYSDHAVRLYRSWLQGRYGTIDDLNQAYGTRTASWQLIDPPRRMSSASARDLLRMLDWSEFGEHYINESVRSIAAMLRELFGDGVPYFHNYPVTLPVSPLDMTGAEEFLDFQGVDAYPQKTAYHGVRCGVKYTSAMSRLPVMAEFSSGSIYYALPLSLDDQTFTTWSILMHGIRGVNFYMIVERERWYGSPVKRDGGIRSKHYAFFTSLLERVRAWGLEEMTCERPVMLLLNREYDRLANAASLLSPVSLLIQQFTGMFDRPPDRFTSDESYGLAEPVASRYLRMLAFWYWALTASGAHFAMGDTSVSPETLSGYRMVIVPTFEFMDAGVQARLLAFAEAGGTLVLGPRAPSLDGRMNLCDTLARHLREPAKLLGDADLFGVHVDELALYADDDSGPPSMTYAVEVGSGRLVHLGLVAAELCGVADAGPFAPMVDTLTRAAGIEPAFVPSDHSVDVAVWSKGQRLLIFVANPTDSAIDTNISHARGGPFVDLETGEAVRGDGTLTLALEPYSIRAIGAGA